MRGWLLEWCYILAAPFRMIRPRAWFFTLSTGVLEILTLLRLVRPRGFSTELVGGGWEIVRLIRLIFRGIAATVVSFFWLLVWSPWYIAWACYHGPIWIWYFLRTRTWLQLTGVAMFVVLCLTGTGGTAFYIYREKKRNDRIGMLRRQYEIDLLEANPKHLETTLQTMAKEMPEDRDVPRRLEMLHAREAPASEPNLVRFFMRNHLTNGRIDDAVREANKLLESFPDDWEVHCTMAKVALFRGDLDGAKKWLATLPPAEKSATPIPLSVARDSAWLFKAIGDDARYDDMVEFITANILPELKGKDMVRQAIPFRLFLIDCYYLALTRLDKNPGLTKYWEPLELAFQSIMDDPNVDAATLAHFGDRGQKEGLIWLEAFRTQKLITQDEYLAMCRDLFARQQALWFEVIRRDPKLPSGYIGLAVLVYSKSQGGPVGAMQAEQTIDRGLKECGPIWELVKAGGLLLGQTDPQRGLRFLERKLRDQDMTTDMCAVVDEVAARAGRPDTALAACRRALKLDPAADWARLREATHCLKLDRPEEAVAALQPIEAKLVKYPDGCADYVRALCDTGRDQEADNFLARLTAGNCPAEVLIKTAEGLQATGRHYEAIRWANQAIQIDNRNAAAWMAVGSSTYKLADRGETWDPELVREAIHAYRAALRQQPGGDKALRAVNNIAWLELKALHLPKEAFESAAPLRAIENRVDLKAEYLETLGAVYLGVGQYEKAATMLAQAIRTTGPRPSFCTHLALAYHGLGDKEQAELYLSEAARLSSRMLPKDAAEFREASKTIRGR
jgi:tetratricopeptide (TPR) repeat protein